MSEHPLDIIQIDYGHEFRHTSRHSTSSWLMALLRDIEKRQWNITLTNTALTNTANGGGGGMWSAINRIGTGTEHGRTPLEAVAKAWLARRKLQP